MAEGGQATSKPGEFCASVDLECVPQLLTPAEWPWQSRHAAQEASASLKPRADSSEGGAVGEDGIPSGTDLAAGKGEANFQEAFWERFDLLWQRRVEPSQRLLEQVVDRLQKRAELERKYGESLVGFSCDVPLNPQEDTVHGAVDSVMVNFRNRGEQALELAEEIEQDIVTTLEAVLKQHREVGKRIHADVQLLTRYVQEKRKAYEKLARKYSSKCAEAESVALECLQGHAMKTADRIKLGQRATVVSKQARLAEHEYYASIEQANRAQACYNQQMPVVLAALQDMEEKRGKCLKDGLMKLAVYETSWLRNLQYDLEGTVKAGEKANPAQDLQAFSEKHREECQPREARQFAAQNWFQLGKAAKEGPIQPVPISKAQQDVHAVMRQICDDIGPRLRSLLTEESCEEGMQDWLERLRLNLGDPPQRAALCQMLRSEVLRQEANQANQCMEPESAKSLWVSPAAFDVLVSLFKAALGACDEQHDYWCGRDLMVLAQLLRTDGDGKQVLVLSKVYNHALWNKVSFWEEILLIGLCEAHSAEAVLRRSLSAGSQFNQPAMTAFLQRFVGYMLAFGISFEQGRNSVWATLRKHNSLLGKHTNPYGTLLLQAYEAATPAQSGGSAPAVAPRVMLSEDADREDGTASAATSGPGGDHVLAASHTAPVGYSAGPGEEEAIEEDEEAKEAAGATEDDFESIALGVQGASSAARSVSQADPASEEAAPGSRCEASAEEETAPATSDEDAAEAVDEISGLPGKDFGGLEFAAAQRSTSDVFS